MHIVAIPMLGWLANTGQSNTRSQRRFEAKWIKASGIYMLHVMKSYGPGGDDLHGPLVGANVAFCVTTLFTNLISSCIAVFAHNVYRAY